jgi:hypothetical protein
MAKWYYTRKEYLEEITDIIEQLQDETYYEPGWTVDNYEGYLKALTRVRIDLERKLND